MKPRKPARKKTTPARLPETYGTKRLFLVARDPRWLYAHWDFSRKEQHALNKLSADGHLGLRIYKNSPGGRPVAQVKIHAEARHWFLPVGHGDTHYVAELGYDSKRHGWVGVTRSNVVLTPSETIAPDTSLLLATLPPDVPFSEMLETLGATVAENLPLVELVEKFRAAGQTALSQVSVTRGEKRWSPAQARTLAKIAGAERIRGRMARELASLSAAHILPEPSAEIPAEELSAHAPEEIEDVEGLLSGLLSSPSVTSPGGGWSGNLS